MSPRASRRSPTRPWLGRRQLTALVDEALVDAYDESEQRIAFLTMLQEHLTVPFATTVLGAPVQVTHIDLNDADEIVAICRRGAQRQAIPILDLPLPGPPPGGWQWIEAYRYWARSGR